MKTILTLAGGIIILGLIILGFAIFDNRGGQVAGYSNDDPNAPRLELLEKNYDFGKISLDSVVKHDFLIKNTGVNPLVINNLMTSCHCTSVIFKVPNKPDSPAFGMHQDAGWQGEIASGQQAVVEVIYEPAKMPVKGQVTRVITFNSNDPANRDVQLEIIAVVE